MKSMTRDEARTWCLTHDLGVTSDNYLYYDLENPNCFCVDLVGKVPELIALSEYLQ